jgi:microcin C transport system permease protein
MAAPITAGVYSPFVAREPADTARSAGPFALSPISRRRLDNFRRNKRGYWSLWIFLILFVVTLFAELLANDRPLLAMYRGELLFPSAMNGSRYCV